MTLVVEHVDKSYNGKSVLRDVSFTVSEGECLVITGESGCGKTTLLSLILGLEKPDGGHIFMDNTGNKTASVVFQENRLCAYVSAVKNVCAVSPHLSEETARDALLKLLPADSLDKPVVQLSGGMQRRVAVVRACLAQSSVLVMDEPLTGLDADNRKKVAEFIRSEMGARPLIVTAHQNEDFAFCRELHLP